MKQPNEYLSEFMELISLPQESRQVFLEAGKTLLEQQGAEMERLSALFMADPAENAGNVFEQLDKAAEACSIHSYTASYVFLCWNTQELRERYRAKGISDEVFRNTMMDLNYKLTECRHGMPVQPPNRPASSQNTTAAARTPNIIISTLRTGRSFSSFRGSYPRGESSPPQDGHFVIWSSASFPQCGQRTMCFCSDAERFFSSAIWNSSFGIHHLELFD